MTKIGGTLMRSRRASLRKPQRPLELPVPRFDVPPEPLGETLVKAAGSAQVRWRLGLQTSFAHVMHTQASLVFLQGAAMLMI